MPEQTSTDQGQAPEAGSRTAAFAQRLAADTGEPGQVPTSTPDRGQAPPNTTTPTERTPERTPEQDQESWLTDLPDAAQAEIRRLRGEAASHRTARRSAEQERDQLRQAQESEQQRIERERDEAVRERDALRLESMRLRVITAKGLPPDAAAFLTGDTAEELEQNADKLKSMIGNGGQEPAAPDFDAGVRGSAGTADGDMSALIRRAAGRVA